MFIPWAKVTIEYASPKPGERVLDLACGTGAVARQLAPIVGTKGSVVGLEISAAMLDVARSLPRSAGALVDWRQGDGTAMPFADRTFDLVVCQQGLQFFPNRAAGVAEIRRVLVPGGRAVVAVWDSIDLHPVFKAMFGAVASRIGAPLSAVAAPFSLASADELRKLFEGARFADLKLRSRTAEVKFPSPDRFLELSIRGAAAVLPVFSKMSDDERNSMVRAATGEVAPVLAKYRRGDSLVFPMTTHVVVARV
jgi:ubiquinone/menaquinone biosynthesis C-methylase UbiE